MNSLQQNQREEKDSEKNTICSFYTGNFNFKSFYLVSLVNVGLGRYSKPTYFISSMTLLDSLIWIAFLSLFLELF